MAAPRSRPFFRTRLYALTDRWAAGPGLSYSVARFGFWPAWQMGVSGNPPGRAYRSIGFCQLALEMPWSVLPFSIRQVANPVLDLQVPAGWQGLPIPRWRGISCQLGTTRLRLHNDIPSGDDLDLSLLVLLPDQDPSGPRPESIFLGEQFLSQYEFRALFNYSAVKYDIDPATNRRRIDPRVSCGSLSIS